MPPHLSPLLLALALACGSAIAADAATEPNPEFERAARLRDEAKTLRQKANETLAAETPKCYERFQVNRCINQAKEAQLEALKKARGLEAEASRTELAEKRRMAVEAGRTSTDAPTVPAEPAAAESFEIHPDPMAESTRRQREADAIRAQEQQKAERRQKDAQKAKERAQVEAEAKTRAEAAARDRARYEERIRKREADKAEDAAQDASKAVKPAN